MGLEVRNVNVGAFIDLENVRIRLSKFTPSVDIRKIDFFEKLKLQLSNEGYQSVNIFAYDNFDDDFYKKVNVLNKYTGLGISLKNSLNEKNSADIDMCLDALEICLNTDTDIFVLVTSDKDVFPLIRKLKSYHKKVLLIGITFNISNYLVKSVDKFIPLESLIEVPFDEHFIIKKDVVTATKRLYNLYTWAANKRQDLGKDFFIEKLTETLYETFEYCNQLCDILVDNGVADLYKYQFNGKDIDGIKFLQNDITNNILNDILPSFHEKSLTTTV
jgi:uncharacterized LabA/DUF88 family protein